MNSDFDDEGYELQRMRKLANFGLIAIKVRNHGLSESSTPISIYYLLLERSLPVRIAFA
jgi:hypothetical protein